MPIAELMDKLESQVEEAERLKGELDLAKAEHDKATQAYSEAVAIVESLKSELVNKIGNIFPSGSVRQY